MRIYDNPNKLTRAVIDKRLQVLDAMAESSPYTYTSEDGERTVYYVGVDSILTDKDIDKLLGSSPTVAELVVRDLAAELDIAKADIVKLKAGKVDK